LVRRQQTRDVRLVEVGDLTSTATNIEEAGRDAMDAADQRLDAVRCVAQFVCQDCDEEHQEENCGMAGIRVCVVCGVISTTSVCGRCGTWFCDSHKDHDCLTPQSGGRGADREVNLGLLRSELEKGLPGGEQYGRVKPTVVTRVDAPGGWEPSGEVEAGLRVGDEEAWRSRRLGGSGFLAGARSEGLSMAVGGGWLTGIPMSQQDGNRPRSWANPALI